MTLNKIIKLYGNDRLFKCFPLLSYFKFKMKPKTVVVAKFIKVASKLYLIQVAISLCKEKGKTTVNIHSL